VSAPLLMHMSFRRRPIYHLYIYGTPHTPPLSLRSGTLGSGPQLVMEVRGSFERRRGGLEGDLTSYTYLDRRWETARRGGRHPTEGRVCTPPPNYPQEISSTILLLIPSRPVLVSQWKGGRRSIANPPVIMSEASWRLDCLGGSPACLGGTRRKTWL
jgi:hypothetical protein